MDTLSDDQFLFTFPLYSILREPGPQPIYLQAKQVNALFVPLWTDDDLFHTFLEHSGMAGKVSAVTIHSRAEFIAFLEMIPETVSQVIVDPSKLGTRGASSWEKKTLIAELQRDEDTRTT